MNEALKSFLGKLNVFFSHVTNRRLSYLVIICIIALVDFLHSGLVRRTFVFYSDKEGKTIVEDRMLRRSEDKETDIRRYVEEALLGPSSPDSLPLFSRGTRLHSFLYREAVVYADLTETAALPVDGKIGIYSSFLTLNEGIRRNFSFIEDVRLFIGGNEVFFEEFYRIFSNPADNSKTSS
jgi:hypothetical protein